MWAFLRDCVKLLLDKADFRLIMWLKAHKTGVSMTLDDQVQSKFNELHRIVFWLSRDELWRSIGQWASGINMPIANAIDHCINCVLWGGGLPFKIKQIHGGVEIEL